MSQPTGSGGLGKQAYDTAMQNLPWRRDVSWWVILVQGLVLTGLGVFVLANQSGAAGVVLLVAALLLIADGVMAALASMRGRVAGQAKTLNMINAGIALVMGFLGLILVLQNPPNLSTGATLVALGLIVSGALSLVLVLFMRAEGTPLRLLRVVGPIVWIVIGVLALLTLNQDSNFNALQIIGTVSLVVGVVLLILAFVRFRSVRAPAAAA